MLHVVKLLLLIHFSMMLSYCCCCLAETKSPHDTIVVVPQSDVDYSGFKKHLASAHAPKPLTQAEEELHEIRKNEVSSSGDDGAFRCGEVMVMVGTLV